MFLICIWTWNILYYSASFYGVVLSYSALSVEENSNIITGMEAVTLT